MLDLVERSIGYRPEPRRDNDYWTTFFSEGFVIDCSVEFRLPQLQTDQIKNAVTRFIYSESPTLMHSAEAWRVAAAERLTTIRLALNEHRECQAMLVLHLRKS
jgi:hypothetical protein